MSTINTPQENDINMELLPNSMRELVRVLGFTAALKLIQARGGAPLVVPQALNLHDPSPAVLRLLDDIGAQAAAALVEWAGGGTLNYLPKYDAVARQLRHEQVRQLRRDGFTLSEIANKSGYSQRWVIKILGLDDDDRQLNLFLQDAQANAAQKTKINITSGSAHNPFGLSISDIDCD